MGRGGWNVAVPATGVPEADRVRAQTPPTRVVAGLTREATPQAASLNCLRNVLAGGRRLQRQVFPAPNWAANW